MLPTLSSDPHFFFAVLFTSSFWVVSNQSAPPFVSYPPIVIQSAKILKQHTNSTIMSTAVNNNAEKPSLPGTCLTECSLGRWWVIRNVVGTGCCHGSQEGQPTNNRRANKADESSRPLSWLDFLPESGLGRLKQDLFAAVISLSLNVCLAHEDCMKLCLWRLDSVRLGCWTVMVV